MDIVTASKVIVGLFSAFGTIALYRYNNWRALQARAVLIQQLEDAIQSERQYSATELFRMLHGMRMKYSDLKSIVNNDRVAHVIWALQKTPGMVSFEHGVLKYTSIFERGWVQRINKWVSRVGALFFAILTTALIITAVLAKGITSLVILILLIPSSAFLFMKMRDIRYDQMIDSLVKNDAA